MAYQEIHQEIEMTNEERWFAEKVKSEYSDHTKAMFRQFVLMHNEITLMGIDPDLLCRALNKHGGE
jgi:hypothetical protein